MEKCCCGTPWIVRELTQSEREEFDHELNVVLFTEIAVITVLFLVAMYYLCPR